MNNIIEEIKKIAELNNDEEQILIDILDNYGIVGRKNKKIFMEQIMNKLNKTKKEADDIYNLVASIAVTELKNKLIHPFDRK